jgi:hypothetical protein
MSLGMATTAVPPCLGVPPVDADGSTDGAADAPVDGAAVAGAAVGAVLVAAPPHAANTIAVTAKSAPIRTCLMLPPPPDGSPVACADETRQRRTIRTRHRIAWPLARRIRRE